MELKSNKMSNKTINSNLMVEKLEKQLTEIIDRPVETENKCKPEEEWRNKMSWSCTTKKQVPISYEEKQEELTYEKCLETFPENDGNWVYPLVQRCLELEKQLEVITADRDAYQEQLISQFNQIQVLLEKIDKMDELREAWLQWAVEMLQNPEWQK